MILGNTYDYSVTIRRDDTNPSRWIGQCGRSKNPSDSPGPVGKRAFFEFQNERITLRRTQSRISIFFSRRYKYAGPPSQEYSFEVGPALKAYITAGDKLSNHSFGTGDKALAITRNGQLVIAVGSIAHLRLGNNIRIQEDRRVEELPLYDFAEIMHYPRTYVVWFDARENNLKEFYRKVNDIPKRTNLIIAVTGHNNRTWERCRHNSDKPLIPDLGEREKNTKYHMVDSRFTDEQTWLEYMHKLPRKRPEDLHIAVTIDGASVKLCEGEGVEVNSYYVFVERVYHCGMPGLLSSLLIARMQPGVTKEMLLASLEAVDGLSRRRLFRRGPPSQPSIEI